MTHIQFLTMTDCHNCEVARKIFDEVLSDFPKVKVEEIDIASDKGQSLASKYTVMASPGVIIDGELFSSGGVNKDKLIKKIKSQKDH